MSCLCVAIDWSKERVKTRCQAYSEKSTRGRGRGRLAPRAQCGHEARHTVIDWRGIERRVCALHKTYVENGTTHRFREG